MQGERLGRTVPYVQLRRQQSTGGRGVWVCSCHGDQQTNLVMGWMVRRGWPASFFGGKGGGEWALCLVVSFYLSLRSTWAGLRACVLVLRCNVVNERTRIA
jgi:hypothetical protein